VTSNRRARAADDGVTLVELAVASAVASVLLAVVALLVVGALRTIDVLTVRSGTTGDARIALEAVSRNIRVAVRPPGASAALVSASTTQLSFWALLNRGGQPADAAPTPTFVTLGYDGRCLTQSLTPAPGGAVTVTPPAVTGPAGCLLRTTRPPVFTYYPTGDPATAASPLPANPQLAAADLLRVGSVRVLVQAQDPRRTDVAPLPVTVQVALENVSPAAN
jgi:type II secretory pathway pseudopilin PulG